MGKISQFITLHLLTSMAAEVEKALEKRRKIERILKLTILLHAFIAFIIFVFYIYKTGRPG